MSRTPKLNTDLSELSDPLFYDAAMLIFNLLTLNLALYPGIPIIPGALGPLPVGSLGAFITVFNGIRTSAPYAGKTGDTATARLNVQKAITKDGNWLNDFCQGDLGLLQKTGYPLQKAGEAQGVLDATVITLAPGLQTMDFYISVVKGGNLKYGVMYTKAANTETNPAKWTFHYAGHRDGTITGLNSKEDYKFVSFAMGTVTTLTYSDPVIGTAL